MLTSQNRTHLRPLQTRIGFEQTARTGAIYVSVLLTSLIVSVTTLAGLMMLELRLTKVTDSGGAQRARQLSDSAMALMLARINNDPQWRTKYTNGVATSPEEFDGGTFWSVLSNPQNDLEDEGDRTVELVVHSRHGNAGHALAATLEPEYSPNDLVNYSVFVSNDLAIDGGVTLTTDGNVVVGGNVSSGISRIYGNSVEATQRGVIANILNGIVNAINGGSTPTDTSWVEEYAAIGTEIPISSIPGEKIEKVVLSPTHNPYGVETNPRGIYYVRCNGRKIEIMRSRIEGTLILFDCKNDSVIREQVNWQTYEPGMPALVAQGGFRIQMKSDDLNENSENTNFNPSHSPFQGQFDNDEDDIYPSRIQGPVVITGDAEIDADPWLWLHGGLYVLNNLQLKRSVRIQRDDALIENPPPGFRTVVGMRVVNGTIRSTVTSD